MSQQHANKLLAGELYEFLHDETRVSFKLDDVPDGSRDGVTWRDVIELAHGAAYSDPTEGCEYFAIGPYSWCSNPNLYDAIGGAIIGASYWTQDHIPIQVLVVPSCDMDVSGMNGAPAWDKGDEPEGYKAHVKAHGKPKWVLYHHNGTAYTEEEAKQARAKEAANRG